MSQAWMITCPRARAPKKVWKVMLEKFDIHKWIIADEVGKNGLRHWQIRLVSSSDGIFEWYTAHIGAGDCQKANQEWSDYERKSGNFITSEDTNQIRQIRFGNLRPLQRKILQEVRTQNDRQVDVYFDPLGNHGKTWLTLHLWERGLALVVPRASSTAEKLSAFVCSSYNGQPYVILDIPRSRKITDDFYEAVEELKDGLVFDHRYSGHCRNVRGVKIIIFTNNELNTRKLSMDRWRLHGIKHDDF